MSETIDVDMESFVAHVERNIKYRVNHDPPVEAVEIVARKLCDLAFEARDMDMFMASGLMIMIAECMLRASRDEMVAVFAAVMDAGCCQELIHGWAEDVGVRVNVGPIPMRLETDP